MASSSIWSVLVRRLRTGDAAGRPYRTIVRWGRPATGGGRSGSRLLAHLVGLDHVLDLQVVERAQVDAALEALANLGDVVLEPAQAGNLDVLTDDDASPGDPGPSAAPDLAGADEGPGHVAEL